MLILDSTRLNARQGLAELLHHRADLGVASGIGEGLLIRKGEIVKKLPESELLPALKAELDRMVEEKKAKE